MNAILNSSHFEEATALCTIEAGVQRAASLSSLIDETWRAIEALALAVGHAEEMERDYFALRDKEHLLPLEIGGAVTLRIEWSQKEWAVNDCKKLIISAYETQQKKLAAMAHYAPELYDEATATLRKMRAKDLRKLRSHVSFEQQCRDEHGYGKAEMALDEASDAEIAALDALCAFPCTTLAEHRMKGAFLIEVADKRCCVLSDEQIAALLQSMAQ